MSNQHPYQPPYTITPAIVNFIAKISEVTGRLTVIAENAKALRLRRINRVRTIHSSLAIEGNTLSEAQITAILDGKRVIAPPREVQVVKNALFAGLPVESLIFEHQAEYYQAIQESTRQTDSAPFIAFMLRMILDTLITSAPQVRPQVTPQVSGLLTTIQGEMGREALQSALGLSDRKSFRERYLKPALADGLIEMTLPDKPNSRLQKYRLTAKGRQWLVQHGER
ncbi:hypothetical protein Pcar_1812 [Syntrophotalea carbinolica DSM 2380]|uniref:Filamentation induced by cAMP protein Fic-like C-terminal domain-containing protein n=1 Tax=Syntrophotalea carbinolica (strain DSM 2380 / NBRC 103641 / GraBd1) TaxID=338963 RepID=Q3A3K4_SYNC1|nr:hypothetical protein [Syntrophotalea carbinolica]ABA89053.1 hypothetical protein Pcar_1812 [Syntrophotalea carbinolica DSM 2380]